ncbi:hypothetical protein V1525DRAFT_420628 [Lipomyces kononenkoae]|uniref:Uncharacterized protein n=1 Tax=Lipomyces kononenkoae TaxID=34357 RepID=A0ACC3SX18_LIPKO
MAIGDYRQIENVENNGRWTSSYSGAVYGRARSRTPSASHSAHRAYATSLSVPAFPLVPGLSSVRPNMLQNVCHNVLLKVQIHNLSLYLRFLGFNLFYSPLMQHVMLFLSRLLFFLRSSRRRICWSQLYR